MRPQINDPPDPPKTAKKSKRRESDMTKEKWGTPDLLRKVIGEDPTKMIAEVTPGKKGGSFDFPFGGHMTIPSGSFQSKKDVVTCCMVSPSNRFKYLPPLRPYEKLLSEIFLYSFSAKKVKKPVTLHLPYYAENTEICDVVLMMKCVKDDEWKTGEFKTSKEGKYLEFAAESSGIYAVISVPKTERLDVPAQGCLYNTKLSHQISLRFPKKATDTDMMCDVRILPLNRRNLPTLREDHPHDMADLVTASDFFDIKPSIYKEFKRPITLKLPLPPLDVEEFPDEDMAVMHLTTQNTWELLDTTLKFTKSSVSFDTRVLTRFCVALARPQRKKRLHAAFKHIHDELNAVRGEIIPFLHIHDKSWTVWFDCVPGSLVEDTINRRLSQGFKKLEQAPIAQEEEKPSFRGRHWKTRNAVVEKKPERTDLSIVEGKVYQLEVCGDVTICEDDFSKHNTGLQFHEKLPENYRRFSVEPHERSDGRMSTGLVNVYFDEYHIEDGGLTSLKCWRSFSYDVDPEAVKNYYYVEPEPEPEVAPPVPHLQQVLITAMEPVAPPPPVVKKPERPKTMSAETFLRLITPTKPPRKVNKESKVLSGRSLSCLAQEVEQGLTLAIYLDLNDSTITGMGFDALAKGQSLVDITYKILLLWKRKTNKYKDKQIDLLVRALQEMGRNDAATAVLDKHRENSELTPDCFRPVMAPSLPNGLNDYPLKTEES